MYPLVPFMKVRNQTLLLINLQVSLLSWLGKKERLNVPSHSFFESWKSDSPLSGHCLRGTKQILLRTVVMNTTYTRSNTTPNGNRTNSESTNIKMPTLMSETKKKQANLSSSDQQKDEYIFYPLSFAAVQ